MGLPPVLCPVPVDGHASIGRTYCHVTMRILVHISADIFVKFLRGLYPYVDLWVHGVCLCPAFLVNGQSPSESLSQLAGVYEVPSPDSLLLLAI